MHITTEDVGRKVVHRNGDVSEIVEFGKTTFPVGINLHGTGLANYWLCDDGSPCITDEPNHAIAFLDEFTAADWEKLTEEGKQKMSKPSERRIKHVIAGEDAGDVLEWRLHKSLGSVVMQVRAQDGEWAGAVSANEQGEVYLASEGFFKAFGLTLQT